MMRVAPIALVAAALLLAGCGGHKASKTNFVAPTFPLYPGSYAPKIKAYPTYQTADFTLPQGTKAAVVYAWYTTHLPPRGWKITQKNETGIHAEKGELTADIGVRGQTLEINQQ